MFFSHLNASKINLLFIIEFGLHDIMGMLLVLVDIGLKIKSDIGQHADIRQYNNW